MLRYPHLLLPTLACLLASAGAASAQTISSPYRYVDEGQSLTLFGGYPITNMGELGLGPESRMAGGIRYSLRLGGPFTAEANASLFPTTRSVLDTVAIGQPLAVVGQADLSLLLVDASLRFNITGPRTYHGLQPYALFGGGAASEVRKDDSVEEAAQIGPDARFHFGTRFAGHVGAGLEWFVLRQVALRAEARDAFWKLKTPPAFLRQGGDVPKDEWVQNFMFSLGLAYHF